MVGACVAGVLLLWLPCVTSNDVTRGDIIPHARPHSIHTYTHFYTRTHPIHTHARIPTLSPHMAPNAGDEELRHSISSGGRQHSLSNRNGPSWDFDAADSRGAYDRGVGGGGADAGGSWVGDFRCACLFVCQWQAGRQTCRQVGRQTGRQADK